MRLRYAYDMGCDTVDGTGYSRIHEKAAKASLKLPAQVAPTAHTLLTRFQLEENSL